MLLREDIVNRLSDCGHTKRLSETMLDDIVSVITNALAAGDSVRIQGFGTFKVQTAKPKRIVDCGSGEAKITKPCRLAKFVPGRNLKRVVRLGDPDDSSEGVTMTDLSEHSAEQELPSAGDCSAVTDFHGRNRSRAYMEFI